MKLRLGCGRSWCEGWSRLNLWAMDEAMPATHTIGRLCDLPRGGHG